MSLPEAEDVQRLLMRGYRERPATSYLLLRVREPQAARAWLARLVEATRRANDLADHEPERLEAHLASEPALIGTGHPGWRREDEARVRRLRLTLAFTHQGLAALGLPSETLAGFVPEFRQGMDHPNRSRVLGDVGAAAPERWRWGSAAAPVHLLCAVFASGHGELEDRRLDSTLSLATSGLEVVERIQARLSEREPFGFVDGISQPRITGMGSERQPALTRWDNEVPAGEFILGHRNLYGRLPLSPHVAQRGATAPDLPAVPGKAGHFDFGKNGSFLVARQLAQDVEGFERFVAERTEQELSELPRPIEDATRALCAERIRARMVGRHRDGSSLVLAPEGHDPARARDNDFGYAREDRFGQRCPLGAHVRRANPRDGLTDDAVGVDAAAAMARVNHHRLLRRSRVYPQRGGVGQEQGIFFLAFGANLERQFEFVQQSWIHGSHFDGLKDEHDPLLPGGAVEVQQLTIQRHSIASAMPGLSAFVRVRGGAYFFMPGLRALAHLARESP